jgi:RNA-directed DNA polymerase
VLRVKTKISDILVPRNLGPWPDVRDRLNSLLAGWSAYFSYGTRLQAYRAVDNHVYNRVRHFLTRRHKVRGQGTRQFSDGRIFGPLGVLRLRRVHIGPPPCASR